MYDLCARNFLTLIDLWFLSRVAMVVQWCPGSDPGVYSPPLQLLEGEERFR